MDAEGTLAVAVQALDARDAAAAALVVCDVAAGRPVRVIRANPVIGLTVGLDNARTV
jgi:hypothetical protein